MIREAFRLSAGDLDGLGATYDWVFNARRALLDVKTGDVLEEVRGLIGRLRLGERKAPEKADH